MHSDRDPDATTAGTKTEDSVGGSGDDRSRSVEPSPTGRTGREQAALGRVHGVSRLLDEAVRVPGTNFRVGLDPIMGIVPVGGDAVATVFALYPILEAIRFGLPTATIVKMVLLVAVDSVIGSIPVLGTAFDAVWKANAWNARTLERHLQPE